MSGPTRRKKRDRIAANTIARDGYGLGLTVVKAVIQAHHAALTATAPPEGGLSTTVRFTHTPHRNLSR